MTPDSSPSANRSAAANSGVPASGTVTNASQRGQRTRRPANLLLTKLRSPHCVQSIAIDIVVQPAGYSSFTAM
jgi:hypothetical protein